MNKNSVGYLLLSGVGIALFLGGLLVGSRFPRNCDPSLKPVRQSGFLFTNPLLDCEQQGDVNSPPARVVQIKNKVQEAIRHHTETGNIQHASLYFRDLNNGPWYGLDENEKFSPASLLKVPLMIAYLKKAENDPAILNKAWIYKKADRQNVSANITNQNHLVDDMSYTVLELIEFMIKYSDNNAAGFLIDKADLATLNKVYSDLGLAIHPPSTSDDLMSVKEYASFFRVLFNASYLNRDMSEKALSILSMSTFNGGLTSKLPKGTKVAHKFGERVTGETKQLHDCGIVYYPNRPYIICIMTRGDDFQQLADVIGLLSRIIYDGVDGAYHDGSWTAN